MSGGRWVAAGVWLGLGLAGCAKPPVLQTLLDAADDGQVIELPQGPQPEAVVRRAVKLVGQGPATQLAALTIEQPGVVVHLEALGLGQGLTVPVGGVVSLDRVTVGCSAAQAAAVRVEGRLTALSLEVAPGCHRALDVQGGEVTLRGARLAGKKAAARVVDGSLFASDTAFQATEPDGVGLFAARSRLTLEQVSLSGGAQGLLVRGGDLSATGLRAEATSLAGLALVDARAEVKFARLVGPFATAALQISESPAVTVTGLAIEAAGATGVLALRSRIQLSELDVAGATRDSTGDFGHAVSLQDATASIRGLSVADLAGAAVYVADSTAHVRGLQGHDLGTLLVALRSEVSVHGGRVGGLEGSPVVYAADAARVVLRGVEAPASVAPARCLAATVTDGRGTSLCPSP